MARRHEPRTSGPDPTDHSAPLYRTPAVLVLTLLLPLYILPAMLYRWLVILLAKLFRPDLCHMLRGQGALFLADAVHTEPNLNLLIDLTLDSTLDPQRAINLLMERLVHSYAKNGAELAFPELKMHCVKWAGYFFWTPEADFSIHDHAHFRKLEEGEDVSALKNAWVLEPLVPRRSPWLFLVLEDGSSGRTHALFKVHHSLADGYSLVRVLCRLVDSPPVFLDPSKYLGEDEGFRYWLTFPANVCLEIWRSLTVRSALLPWPRIPSQPYAGAWGERAYVLGQGGRQRVEMALLKGVARRHSVSVTSVVYAAFAGALRAHLLTKFGPESIPECIRFPQPVPVLHHEEGLCNRLSSVTFRLPVGESDPAARLRACHETILGRKRSAETAVAGTMLNVLGMLPCTAAFHFRPGPGGVDIGVTNLPGPLQTVWFDGLRVYSISIQGGPPPLAFYAAFWSYDGVLSWNVGGDTRVLDETEIAAIGRDIHEEFEMLEKMDGGSTKENV